MALDDYVLALVMAGGRGTRLSVLTRDRTKSAVSIHGENRLIDYALTNISNTGIPGVIIVPQYAPQSLINHVGLGEIWGYEREDKKLEVTPPHEEGKDLFVTFVGTADSVRKSMDRIKKYDPRVVLVLAGDHVYCMNYEEAIKQHKGTNADVTILANPIPENKVNDFGIMMINEEGKVIDFAEKPKNKEIIERFRLTNRTKRRLKIHDPKLNFLASMGNYVFFQDKLESILRYQGDDFGKNIIPAIKENDGKIYAHIFEGYWRDVGKIKDYFDCNMEFTREKTPIDLTIHRVKTAKRNLPATRIARGAQCDGCILSAGDEISSGSLVTNSVLGYQVLVEENCRIDNSIFLGANRNEYFNNIPRREYYTLIGAGSRLEYALFDKNVRIGKNVSISPRNGTLQEREAKLISIGLKPYKELPNGRAEGDFSIDPETNILVLGKQTDSTKLMIPDNYEG